MIDMIYPVLMIQADQEAMIIEQENAHITITFAENVDLANSLFFVDEEQIELTSTIEWTMEEDTNQIDVVLYDHEQKVIYIDTFVLTCDKKAPEISVRHDGYDIDSLVYLKDSLELNLACTDESEIEVLASLNDETLAIMQTADGYSIQCDKTGMLHIVCTDAFGNVSERTIQIKPFEFAWLNETYSLGKNWKPEVSTSIDDIEIDLYKDERLIHSWTSEDDLQPFTLDDPGEYKVKARSLRHPYLSFEDDIFYYETGDMYFELDAKKEGILRFEYDENYFKAGQVKIYDGKDVKILDLQKIIEYEFPANAKIDFAIEATLVDLFGRTSTIFDLASFDHKAPVVMLYVNDVITLSGSTIDFEDPIKVNWTVDDATFEQISYTLNGKPKAFGSLEEAFRSMKAFDELIIDFLFEDADKNQTVSTLTFIKHETVQELPVEEPIYIDGSDDEEEIEPVKTNEVTEIIPVDEPKEVVSTTIISHEKASDKQVIRTWRIEDETLALVDQEITQVDPYPISIEFYTDEGVVLDEDKEEDRVRIVLQTKDEDAQFESVTINGQDVPLDNITKDGLGMDMIEVELEEDENEIIVKAVDEQGNEIKKTQKVNVSKDKPWLVLLIIPAFGIIFVYILRYKKHA